MFGISGFPSCPAAVTRVGQRLPCSIHEQIPRLRHTSCGVTWFECVPLGKPELHKQCKISGLGAMTVGNGDRHRAP